MAGPTHPSPSQAFPRDVVVVGGCGHVGLPLAIAMAERGLAVVAYDIDAAAVERIRRGEMPFAEEGAAEALARALTSGRLEVTTDSGAISTAEAVIVVVGTPVDEHLNPDPQAVPTVIEGFAGSLVDGQLLVLRSTLYPGVTALVERLIQRLGIAVDVVFCPERIAEGRALTEIYELPQIVAARQPEAGDRAEKLFRTLAQDIVRLEPEEAELAKLFTNSWRYLKFAIANQFFMIANDFGLDYERIRSGLAYKYPRAVDLPSAGFAAGPCLFKDTMQLAAFNNNNFVLGHAAMQINEGLPLYVVSRMEERFDLPNTTVGILGMAFKAESDDRRSSLSYKLKRILRFKAADVLCADPHVTDDADLLTVDEVVERADVLVIGTPHAAFAGLATSKPVIDIWDLYGEGARV